MRVRRHSSESDRTHDARPFTALNLSRGPIDSTLLPGAVNKEPDW